MVKREMEDAARGEVGSLWCGIAVLARQGIAFAFIQRTDLLAVIVLLFHLEACTR